MKAVIIIPTYNERENVRRLLPRLQKVVSKIKIWRSEVLVVDDNSPDKTAEVVRSLTRKNKNVHLLWRPRKKGLGAAYLAGMQQAFDWMKADVVLLMDADLSHDPSYIPDFIRKIEAGADFVIGSRYIKGGAIAESWAPHRKFLSVFGNKIVSWILAKKGISDWTSGYRAVTRRAFKAVYPSLAQNRGLLGYTFNVSFAYQTLVLGFSVAEVPIKFIDRTAGKSKLGFEYLIHTPAFILKTRIRELLGGIFKL